MYARAKNIARAIAQSNEIVRRTGAWASELALGTLDDSILPKMSLLPLSGTVQRAVHFAREEVAALFERPIPDPLEPEHGRKLRRKVERERDVLIIVLSHVLGHNSPPALEPPSFGRPSLLSSYHLSTLEVLSEEDETEEEAETTSISESSSTSSTDMMNSESPGLDVRSATTRTISNKSILKSKQQPSSLGPQRITSERRVQFAAQQEPSPSPEPVKQQRRKSAPLAPALAPHPYQLAFNKRKQFWLPPKAHVQSPTVVQADEGRTDVAIAELVQ